MLVGLVQELHSQLAKVSAETQMGAGEAVTATHFVRESCPWGHHGATGHRVLDSLSSSSRELLGCPQGDSQGPGPCSAMSEADFRRPHEDKSAG